MWKRKCEQERARKEEWTWKSGNERVTNKECKCRVKTKGWNKKIENERGEGEKRWKGTSGKAKVKNKEWTWNGNNEWVNNKSWQLKCENESVNTKRWKRKGDNCTVKKEKVNIKWWTWKSEHEGYEAGEKVSTINGRHGTSGNERMKNKMWKRKGEKERVNTKIWKITG